MGKNRFALLPITAAEANLGIARFHRHAGPVIGAKFAFVAWDRDRAGVAGCMVVGRPVSRILDDGVTLEVNRLAVDPDDTANLCSQFLGAAARLVFKHRLACQLVTYTLAGGGETGASLRAAGWALDVDAPLRPRKWNMRPGRTASAVTPAPRLRWRKIAPWVLKRNSVFDFPQSPGADIRRLGSRQTVGDGQLALQAGQRGRPGSSSDNLHPAFVMGRKAAASGARRDSNPFLRYPVKDSLRVHLIEQWDLGWLSCGLDLTG